MSGTSTLVGRTAEMARIGRAIEQSALGTPSAIFVCGEAGVGKTRLVATVTEQYAARGHLVLWGRCLRFGADSSPYLPIGQALTQWYRQADAAERVRVLTGAAHLASIAPALGAASEPADVARVPPLVGAVVDRLTDSAPLAMVIDDAQWADGSSLDLLAYLMAGFGPGQRLCLLVTYRDTELGDGHRLHGWMADCARLPSVDRLRLDRLDLADTEELVLRLRGAGSGRLAEQVYEKSGGNPYYSELLVRGHDAGPDAGGDGLPATLLGSWHRLPPAAREVLQLLAVGGRPVTVGVLEQLVAARGGAPEEVATALADARAAGLTTMTRAGDVWFHHPLVAEVVATTLTPAARRTVHRQYVDVIRSSTDLTTASRAAHLALHHHGAGEADEAFMWSLRAADEAAGVHGYAEVSEHLQRACLLWDEIGAEARAVVGDRGALWHRASTSAWSAGENVLAVRLREEAIAFVDAEHDPVRAVRLRLPLHTWRGFCGLEDGPSVEAERPVLRLAAAACPGTPEHVEALARLAHAEAWSDDPAAAVPRAAAAVRLARRTGSPEALAWALGARSLTPPWDRALADARTALSLAGGIGTPELVAWAASATANRLSPLGRDLEAADLLLTTFWRLVTAGSVYDAMWVAGTWAAQILIDFGRWQEARRVLQLQLARRLPAGLGAEVRGVAALLALRAGDMASGRMHLDRARELRPRASHVGELLALLEVEAAIALAAPREALMMASQRMPAYAAHDPSGGDELLVLTARAAADLAEMTGARAEAMGLLDLVEQQRAPGPPSFESSGPEDLVHPARGALFVAERARCHGVADTATPWRTAVTRCGEAGLVWHEALSSYRLARALVVERGPRGEAASALRHAARIATDLGAIPILRDAEELARQVHVPLAEPAPTATAPGARDDPLSSLTAREGEVLSHLMAGRTYAEIARALFISEKTVSVHVSNLLRKTGTRSRLEVTQLARRTSGTA